MSRSRERFDGPRTPKSKLRRDGAGVYAPGVRGRALVRKAQGRACRPNRLPSVSKAKAMVPYGPMEKGAFRR